MICSCQSLITYKHLKKFLLPSTCDCVLCTCVAPLKSSSFRKAPPKLIIIYYKHLKEKDQVILFATDNTILRSFIKRQTNGTSSDNEWQRMTTIGTTSGTTSDNEWHRETASDTTNENGTVHFKKWMIVILSMIKTETLLQGIDGWY